MAIQVYLLTYQSGNLYFYQCKNVKKSVIKKKEMISMQVKCMKWYRGWGGGHQQPKTPPHLEKNPT